MHCRLKPKLLGDVYNPVFASEKSALAARLIVGHPTPPLYPARSVASMQDAPQAQTACV